MLLQYISDDFLSAVVRNSTGLLSGCLNLLWKEHLTTSSYTSLQILMNVSMVHIAVTHKRLVLTQTEAIVVLVKQDSLAMVQCAQVYKVSNYNKRVRLFAVNRSSVFANGALFFRNCVSKSAVTFHIGFKGILVESILD